MCDCMNRVGEDLQKRLTENMPEGAELSTSIFDKTGWDHQCLNLGNGQIEVMLNYRIAYRVKKVNGDMAKNLTRKETNVRMSFCPFCGEKQE